MPTKWQLKCRCHMFRLILAITSSCKPKRTCLRMIRYFGSFDMKDVKASSRLSIRRPKSTMHLLQSDAVPRGFSKHGVLYNSQIRIVLIEYAVPNDYH
ncbi:hypothetical protein CDAR_466421 [Caerostris darwini]|uniref:Uncharacterized protein n=1 Tax=Caerostris darwini TaxID=1538125 RepID=A0AAV4WPQ0_9ARAC|nr:hypothetical protein CDAR_466421 [Caerostris darwini]